MNDIETIRKNFLNGEATVMAIHKMYKGKHYGVLITKEKSFLQRSHFIGSFEDLIDIVEKYIITNDTIIDENMMYVIYNLYDCGDENCQFLTLELTFKRNFDIKSPEIYSEIISKLNPRDEAGRNVKRLRNKIMSFQYFYPSPTDDELTQ